MCNSKIFFPIKISNNKVFLEKCLRIFVVVIFMEVSFALVIFMEVSIFIYGSEFGSEIKVWFDKKFWRPQKFSLGWFFSTNFLRVCPQYFYLFFFHYFLINLQIFRISYGQKFWTILLGFTSSMKFKLLMVNLFNKSS